MLLRRLLLLCCSLTLGASPVLAAQDYPARPIRLVVGFPPGGISDVLARAVAIEAGNILGQPFVIENRPGAGTSIASDAVARANADGYTLLFQDVTTHAINASLYKKLPYDTIKDFTPIALVSSSPLMLVVNAQSPIQSVEDLVRAAKTRKDGLTYGSSGNGTIIHLAAEMLGRASDAPAMHVPYKGSVPLVQAIMTGEIDYAFSSMPPAVSQVSSGHLRGLAVSTPDRVAVLPDVPTIAEAGVPAAEVVLFNGIMGPAGLPPDVVQTLNAAFAKAVASERVTKTYEGLGAKPLAETTDVFAQQLERDMERYAKVVSDIGAQVD